MKDLRILALSDITNWDLIIPQYENLIKKFDLKDFDIVICNGDLIDEGNSDFHHSGLFLIKDFRKKVKELEEKFSCKINSDLRIDLPFTNKNYNAIKEILGNLKDEFLFSEEYDKIWRKHYVSKFYDFLIYMGKRSKVFVVKGNHDEFDEYDINKINSISGCEEISGKFVEYKGKKFLGLSYENSHYLKQLKPLISKYKNNIDILITHNKSSRSVNLTEFNVNDFILKGHSEPDLMKINGTLFLPSNKELFLLINFSSKKTFEVQTYFPKYNFYGKETEFGLKDMYFNEVDKKGNKIEFFVHKYNY